MRTEQFRLRRDGTVDIDFYRAWANALRKQAIQDSLKLKATIKFMLVAMTLIFAVSYVASGPSIGKNARDMLKQERKGHG